MVMVRVKMIKRLIKNWEAVRARFDMLGRAISLAKITLDGERTSKQ
jgi:hypothetical protein